MSGNSNKLKIIALYSISIFYVMLRFCEFAKKLLQFLLTKSILKQNKFLFQNP